MKGKLPLLLFLLTFCSSLQAQVIIINDNLMNGRMSEIKTTVLDSLTQEPLAFASVYVIPAKDTTITNFTLTDATGAAKLGEVPFGKYSFHVEMMGYKPFIQERYFRVEEVDLGTIRLKPDEYFLQAATVSDIGNPIVVKKDTVEFNASSFRVGANAMLKDLLMRMPGMEVTEDGKVKFNGEEIDKLTVGGRTFFFSDQSTALNNLPASIVDKIRVIDRDTEASRASGVRENAREKVLDVGLKKEYEEGWFGNVGLKGGTTFAKKEGAILRDDRGLLFSGNALLSAYSKKDQLTVIGNAQNIADDNAMSFVIVDDSGEISELGQGLSTSAQLGANLNTSRIKNVETTASANYTWSNTDSGSQTARTTSLDGGDMLSTQSRTGKATSKAFTGQLEFTKEQGKFWFHIRPVFRYSFSDADRRGTAETRRAGAVVNESESRTHSWGTNKNSSIYADCTFRDLGGKEGRNLQMSVNRDYAVENGQSDELSRLLVSSAQDLRILHYNARSEDTWTSGYIAYTEPIGKKWTLEASADYSQDRRDRTRDAFDEAGRNDFYSSVNRTNYVTQEYDLTAQYKFGEDSWLSLGAETYGILQETFSRSYGLESKVGQGEWNWYAVPEIEAVHSWGVNRMSLYIYGYVNQPGPSRMQPVLDISNPSFLSMGNIYLKPNSYTAFTYSWRRNDRERFSTLIFNLRGAMRLHSITNAQWYDANGVLCSIPVNARKPFYTLNGYASFTMPLNKAKTWSLSVNASADYVTSSSFLARDTMPTPDKTSFDYGSFMANFWGDASGDRFFSGQSGFYEGSTRVFTPYASASIKLNKEMYSLALSASSRGNFARYSAEMDVPNRNTLDNDVSFRGSFMTAHEFEFESDIAYAFFKGYAAGYGLPEWRWNASVTKNVGAFTLSLTVHDILNQTRNLRRTVSANYVEDTYRLAMGRYVLFGVKWNFGKMNAGHSQRAQDAAWNLIW